jgi:4a-hydroxytetrahydrobiopterin dehydratase
MDHTPAPEAAAAATPAGATPFPEGASYAATADAALAAPAAAAAVDAAPPDDSDTLREKGWREFLGAAELDDWVVLHGGATAVFRVTSLSAAAALATAITHEPGASGGGLLLTLADDRVSVRLTRDLWNLNSGHCRLARAISHAAREQGAVADRSAVQEVQLAIAAKRDAVDVGFWRAVLGYLPMADDNAVDPLGHGSTVWMQELSEAKALRHAMHVDVSVARDQVQTRLQAAVAAGGRVVDESHAPGHWTLSDRAGNRVCICAWPDGSTLDR